MLPLRNALTPGPTHLLDSGTGGKAQRTAGILQSTQNGSSRALSTRLTTHMRSESAPLPFSKEKSLLIHNSTQRKKTLAMEATSSFLLSKLPSLSSHTVQSSDQCKIMLQALSSDLIPSLRTSQITPSPSDPHPQESSDVKQPDASPRNASFGTTPSTTAIKVTTIRLPISPPRTPYTYKKASVALRIGAFSKRFELSSPKVSTIQIQNSAQKNLTLPAVLDLPQQLLFIVADNLIDSVQGLMEVSTLFANSSEGPLQIQQEKVLKLMIDFLTQNPARIQTVLQAVTYNNIEMLPLVWMEALRKAGTTVSRLYITSLTDHNLSLLIGLFPNLQELKIHKSTVANESAQTISQLKRLHTLIFSCCTLSDEHLAQTLSSFGAREEDKNRLKNLQIVWCKNLTTEGLKPLAHLSGLVTLNLNGYCTITDAVFDFLLPHIHLEELHLSCCDLITAQGLNQLVDKPIPAPLHLLNLTFCKGLFKKGLDVILKFHNLTTLILKRFDHKFAAPEAFPKLSKLQKLRFLDVSVSTLNDTIADELLRMRSLGTLDIRSTKGYSSNFVAAAKACRLHKFLLTGPRSATPLITQRGAFITINPIRSPVPIYKTEL